jgi:hypothetical protein
MNLTKDYVKFIIIVLSICLVSGQVPSLPAQTNPTEQKTDQQNKIQERSQIPVAPNVIQNTVKQKKKTSSTILNNLLLTSVLINFDDLSEFTTVTNQYPSVIFSAGSCDGVSTLVRNLGTSPANIVCTGSCGAGLKVDFVKTVSGLTFYAVGSDSTGVVALIDVYQNGNLTATVNIQGNAEPTTPILVDLSAYPNISKIQVKSVTDAYGLGWDDFSFTVDECSCSCPLIPSPPPPPCGS